MKGSQIEYTTRPANESDYHYCYQLTKENMYDLFCRHWGGWVASAFRKDFDVDSTTIIIHNLSRVGYFSLKRNEQRLYLDNLQLSKSFQGQGLGTIILKTILNNNESRQIDLTTFSDNLAVNLYKRFGFVIVDREGFTVHMTKYPSHH